MNITIIVLSAILLIYKFRNIVQNSIKVIFNTQYLYEIFSISTQQIWLYIALIISTSLIPVLFLQQVNAEGRLIQRLSDPDHTSYIYAIAIVALYQLIHECMWRLRDMLKIYLSASIKQKTFNHFISQIIEKQYIFFQHHSSASIHFIAKQTSSACEKIAILSTKGLICIVYIMITIYKMYTIARLPCICITLLMIAWGISMLCLWGQLSKSSMEYAHINNYLADSCDDIVRNVDIVKSMYMENIEKYNISNVLKLRFNKEIHINMIMWISWVIQGTVFIVIFASIIFYLSNIYSKAYIASICIICMRLLARLFEITWQTSEDIESYIKETGKLKYGLNLLQQFTNHSKHKLIHTQLSSSNIIQCNLQFQYNQNHKLFMFDTHFEQNKITALVGISGAGKSTLVKIIAGLLTPTVGQIYVSQNIKISYMPQKPLIFRESILYNIAYESIQYSNIVHKDNIYYKAIDKSQIDLKHIQDILHQIRFNMPDDIDYDTKLDNTRLSAGQLQKIALARAIYCNADVLILDEPTSSLDHQSMTDMLDIIKNLNNTTRIIVSHSKNTINIADNIIIVDDGRIIYQGTFNDVQNHDEYSKYLA